MRIAFIGHSYHATTGSHAFVLELLGRLGEVDVFYDDSWRTGVPPAWASGFRGDRFDCVFVFQMPEPFEWLDLRHPNLVFAPMLDRHYNIEHFWWREELSAAKVVCFSATLERELGALAPVRFYAQYFPPVERLPGFARTDELAGFLWYRKPPIDPALLRRLTGATVFDRFTLQLAPDPDASAPGPGPRPLARTYEETRSWLADPSSALERLAGHTVYFAPRLFEGIGMSFLEAMALGLCVVAPDTPTHNEYISHGTNGLLYSPSRPAPLAFDDFRSLGRRAREGGARRRALWESAEPDLLEFVSTPKRQLDRRRTLVDFWRRAPVPEPTATRAAGDALPSVSVVTLCTGIGGDLEATLGSLRGQDYPALELLVVRARGASGPAPPGVKLVDLPRLGGEHRAMLGALAEARGEYVLCLHAGDRLVSARSLRRLFEGAPREADVVYGHFVGRDANGTEALCLVGEVGRTCAEFDASDFDARWLDRVPRLQTTAFRASLLRRFGFDPELKFTAAFDLHRRLLRAGARYHPCDEVVALCSLEESWSSLLPLAAPEWLRLAARHGRAKPRRLFAGTGVDPLELWESVLWGWTDRASGRWRKRFGSASSRLAEPPRAPRRVLAAAVRATARRLATAERFLASHGVAAAAATPREGDPAEIYLAAFADGIDFRRRGRPSFVARSSGISWCEPWGRWSDGPRVEIQYRCVLPRHARVVLEAFAHPEVAGALVEIAIGAATAQLTFDGGETFRSYSVELESSGRAMTLTLAIPLPLAAATASRPAAGEGERRRLGLALRSLRIVDLDEA